MAFQKILISFPNFIYGKWLKNMDGRKKNACVCGIFVLAAAYFILLFSNAFYERILPTNALREIVVSILLFAATLFSMKGELRPVKWNRWISVPIIAGGAGLILTGIIHNTGDGYLMFGVMLLTVYPVFYLVWNGRKDYETLFDIITGSNVAVCVPYAIYNFIHDNYSEHFFDRRFKGTTWNANLYGMIGLTLFVSSLYLAYRNRNNKKKVFLYIITALMGLVIIILGKSRATIIIAAISLISVAVYRFKQTHEYSISRNTKIRIAIAAMLVMCMVCVLCISDMASDVTEEEKNNHQVISERFSIEGKDANEFTSGRINIWKSYVPLLNMLGNDVDEIDWDSMPTTKAAHVHNNFLEYGYRCGVPVALVFTVLELIACLMAFIYLTSRGCKRDALLFPVMITAMYFIDSLIDIATLSVERYAPFFFYLVLAIMIDARPNKSPGRAEKSKTKIRPVYADKNNLTY